MIKGEMAKPAPKSQCPAALPSKHFANVDSIVPTRHEREPLAAHEGCDESFGGLRQKLYAHAAKALVRRGKSFVG